MNGPDENLHTLEQAEAAMMNMAVLVANYFKKLLGTGFTRAEALALARDWQLVALGAYKGKSPNDDAQA